MSTATRRQMLLGSLFGAGAIGLRSLATGLPISFLLNPKLALAGGPQAVKPQYLILSVNESGDPINANIPGAAFVSGVSNSVDPQMAQTSFTLAGQSVVGVKPWSTLPQSVLDRTAFFHYASQTIVHPDIPKVLRLFEDIREDMTVSLCSRTLQPVLGCIQGPPIDFVGGIQAEGRDVPTLSPVSLAQTLLSASPVLENLQPLRDRDLNRLNALFKANGTKAERDYLDKLAISQTQVREVPTNLLQVLSTLRDNSLASQLTAACVLFKMNVSAACTVQLPFGGDNHMDANLANETAQHVSTLASLNTFFTTTLPQFDLQDQVTLSVMPVFGRVLASGLDGRTHNGSHCGGFMIGKNVKAGVYGGLVGSAQGNLVASPMSSVTGAASASGDITFEDLLTSYGKTLAYAVGLPQTLIDSTISTGTVIKGAVLTS